MANAIKDFFKKKKLDAKFKMAGSGHRLTDSGTTSSTTVPTNTVPNSVPNSIPNTIPNTSNTERNDRKDLSTKKAAEAAIERIQRQQQTNYNKTNTLENILREERQKITEEYKMKEKVECLVKEDEKLEKRFEEFDAKQRFNCPTIGLNEWQTIDELIEGIYDYIQTNFADDLTLMSVLIIINCNYSLNDDYKQKIDECIKTLDKIVSNLGNSSPEEMEKFKKIRKSKIEKRVLHLKGGLEFLISIGFELDFNDEWLVFNADPTDLKEQICYYRDVLNSAQQFPILLDRQCIVLDSNTTQTEDINNEFFKLSTNEIKREMQSLTQKRELEETLRTKAMKEQKQRKFNSKFTRLRFKFSDGHQLEATFKTSETLSEVKNWLLEHSDSLKEFELKCVRDVFTDQHMDKTLKQLDLLPTATLLIISKEV